MLQLQEIGEPSILDILEEDMSSGSQDSTELLYSGLPDFLLFLPGFGG